MVLLLRRTRWNNRQQQLGHCYAALSEFSSDAFLTGLGSFDGTLNGAACARDNEITSPGSATKGANPGPKVSTIQGISEVPGQPPQPELWSREVLGQTVGTNGSSLRDRRQSGFLGLKL